MCQRQSVTPRSGSVRQKGNARSVGKGCAEREPTGHTWLVLCGKQNMTLGRYFAAINKILIPVEVNGGQTEVRDHTVHDYPTTNPVENPILFKVSYFVWLQTTVFVCVLFHEPSPCPTPQRRTVGDERVPDAVRQRQRLGHLAPAGAGQDDAAVLRVEEHAWRGTKKGWLGL
jgi:hypothetical protein